MKFTDKRGLRNEIRLLRDALSQEERRVKSEQIASKVIKLQEFQEADVVLLYSAMKSEVETALIYEEAKRAGKAIYYPRVIGDTMEFYLVDESTEFETSRFGVREPKLDAEKQYMPKETDVIFVLVPGVVFDESGNRVGYGGGYYDKYLHWLEGQIKPERICKVAVAYQCQMVENGVIERELHDVKMDCVVTENQTICRCKVENSYRYFENKECQYYPCHDMESMNCLFCYCPLNHIENCPGDPKYIEVNGKVIKDCSECTFPHEPGNYDLIIQLLSEFER